MNRTKKLEVLVELSRNLEVLFADKILKYNQISHLTGAGRLER